MQGWTGIYWTPLPLFSKKRTHQSSQKIQELLLKSHMTRRYAIGNFFVMIGEEGGQ
jgi:hypothetical protein